MVPFFQTTWRDFRVTSPMYTLIVHRTPPKRNEQHKSSARGSRPASGSGAALPPGAVWAAPPFGRLGSRRASFVFVASFDFFPGWGGGVLHMFEKAKPLLANFSRCFSCLAFIGVIVKAKYTIYSHGPCQQIEFWALLILHARSTPERPVGNT